jgi:uncharacterized protein YukJ
MALDYIRGNLFDTTQMKPLPYNLPGPDNDLNELFHKYVDKAISMETSEIYAFGQRWGPENKRDPYFGFRPGNGIHDIHMNQGNRDEWVKDDGTWRTVASDSITQTRIDGWPFSWPSNPSVSTHMTLQVI